MKLVSLGALAAVAVLTAGCSGCAVLQKVAAPNEAVLGSTLTDEKALYATEAAFYGANSAARAALVSGLLVKGSPAAIRVADGLKTAHTALLAARAAYKAGDATTYAAKLAAVQETVADVWALIPQKEG